MLFPSPRYGVAALLKLIEAVDAKAILIPETPLPIVTEILKKKEMKSQQIPSAEQCIASNVDHYPFTNKFEECKDDEILCLHTSGTTGFPKPIPYTHDWVSSFSRTIRLRATPGFRRSDNVLYNASREMRVFTTVPPFHASGVTFMVLLPLLIGMTPIYPPAYTTSGEAVDATLSSLEALHKSQQMNVANSDAAKERIEKVVDMVVMVPPCVENVFKHPEKLHRLSQHAHGLCYGGGSIAREAGDAISHKMKLLNAIASTELGLWPLIRPRSIDYDTNPTDQEQEKKEDFSDGRWEYYTFHPAFNIHFDPVYSSDSGDTVFEAIMKRNNGKDWGGYVQPWFKLYPDNSEKRLSDLFIQHPSDTSLYKHYGRSDDLLVFLTNEKFYPTVAEQRIAGFPEVAEALLVGTRRPKAALVLRLEDGEVVNDALWEKIEDVNRSSPVYARVQRNMLLLVQEPFLRTAKGSVGKTDMSRMYERELDTLYRDECSE
ncbi:acetyl-CoA synthetase-like protein [Alternaria alternata]|nr:acetyl-CoA synthetase-like protein [Alternaria alternata]